MNKNYRFAEAFDYDPEDLAQIKEASECAMADNKPVSIIIEWIDAKFGPQNW